MNECKAWLEYFHSNDFIYNFVLQNGRMKNTD